jgi:hypothetical protein
VVGVTFLTVVGVVGFVRAVVVGVVPAAVVTVRRTVVVVTGRVVVVALLVALLVVVEGVVVGVVDTGTVVSEWAALAAYPTKRADVAAEPKKIAWVTCRTRAKRRSRCWGVRLEGAIDLLSHQFSHLHVRR